MLPSLQIPCPWSQPGKSKIPWAFTTQSVFWGPVTSAPPRSLWETQTTESGPNPLNQNLHFNEVPGNSHGTLKSEKFWDSTQPFGEGMVSSQDGPSSSEHRKRRGRLGQTPNTIKLAYCGVLQRGILWQERETLGR